MAEAATKLPVKTEQQKGLEAAPKGWHPFESLHREIDRLFEDFGRDLWRAPFGRSTFNVEPFWRSDVTVSGAPAVDVLEKPEAFEITADLPGLDEKDIEVQLASGTLTIKGEKKEEKEEKKQDYYLKERRFGSFQRSFGVPDGVDADKIAANFNKGVLTIKLPKKPEAQQPSKKIEVKAA